MKEKFRKNLTAAIATAFCVIAFSCSGSDGSGEQNSDYDADESAESAEVEESLPAVKTDVCGATGYKWLDPATLGDVVASEWQSLYSLSKSAINGVIGQTDYKGAVEAKYDVDVYLIRYVTQDRGKTIEATAAYGVPVLAQGETLTDAPTLVWLHGTTGFADACAPSPRDDGGLAVMLMASQGYVTVAPDYIGMIGFGDPTGMFHPYLGAEATAIASWDSARAAKKFTLSLETSVTLGDKAILWGGSQGGHAALATNLYAPYYAPEYKIAAVLALIPPTDLVAHAEISVEKIVPATANLAVALTELARWYGMWDARASEIFPADVIADLPKTLDTVCEFDDLTDRFKAVSDVYNQPFIDSLLAKTWTGFEDWKCILKENSFQTTSVAKLNDSPILFVVSGSDTLVNPVVERSGYDRMCAMGYKMNYIECEGAGHSQGATWSLLEQFSWLSDRLAGKPMTDVCSRPAAVCCKGSDSKVCSPAK